MNVTPWSGYLAVAIDDSSPTVCKIRMPFIGFHVMDRAQEVGFHQDYEHKGSPAGGRTGTRHVAPLWPLDLKMP